MNVVPMTAPRATVDTLIARMTDRWSAEFANTPTRRLQASWRQAFETFERKIAEHGTPSAPDWYVLSPATGTGKSESLKVYAAGTDRPPGIMIVVRLIAQADEFVRDINAMAGRDIAVARHSAYQADLGTLKDYPVLVITHAAFTGRPHHDHDLWAKYAAFQNTARKLVVIDEALDILNIARVQAEDVERILRVVPWSAWNRWPEARSAIETLLNILREIDAKATLGERQPKARLLVSASRREGLRDFEDGWDGWNQLDQLRDWLKSDQHRYLIGKRNVDKDAERRQKLAHDAILKNLIAVYTSFIVHSKDGRRHTFSTGHSLLPDEGQGCVVLDATADTNAIYECMASERLRVFRQLAIRCRDYGNATLKVSFGHSVGRASLVKADKAGNIPMTAEAPKLMASLVKEQAARADTDCPMERVLIVCHQAAEQHLMGFDVPFEYAVGHYGALDGRNDWRDYDSVVIYGLDYRHPTDPGISFIALQGDQKLDPFGDPAGRSFGGHADIVKALERGWIVSSLIQAVNRIRTRRVIDTEGNCPASFVYLALPDNVVGKEVYKVVREQMPGIRTERWDPRIRKTPARSQHEKSLEGLILQMVPGESYTATEVKAKLKVSNSAWERLVPKLRDTASSLGQFMTESGVVYEVERRGKTQVGRLRRP